MDVLAAIKERVGDRLLIGMRYTADETAPGGISEEDVQEARRQ